MPMNRREFVAGAVAGAAVLQQEMNGFAVPEGIIQVRIDASVSGAPINPMIFGGYMEPATTQLWAEILTDRKFANAITSAPTPPPANPFFRRFFGEPFKPVGPEGTVEMDAERAYVGKHSPRVKLDSSQPHGIRQSRLRIGGGKTYEGRLVLAGDPALKSLFVWFGVLAMATRKRLRSLRLPANTIRFHSSSLPVPTLKRRNWKSSALVRAHFTWVPYR
jgi:hypothetical protein